MRALSDCLLALGLGCALVACGMCWSEVSTCLSGFGAQPEIIPSAVPVLGLTALGLNSLSVLIRPR